MKAILSIVSVMVIILALISVNLVSCGGGGGGGGVDNNQQPPPGGSGTGANGVQVFWYSYDVNIAVGSGNAVQETSDHGFIMAGSQASDFTSPNDVLLMKTDSKGIVQWKNRFPWTGGAQANAVRQTSDGGFIIAGQAKMTVGTTNVYLLKTDGTGSAASGWPKLFGGIQDDAGYSVLELSDGYLIAGNRGYLGGDQQVHQSIYAIRTDITGSVVWEKYDYAHFCAGGSEQGRALAATPDGNYVIAGTTGCNGWKGFLLKIDENGHELWRNIYGTSLASAESIYSVATATDGFVLAGSRGIVSGQPPVIGPHDALVIKTAPTGSEIWRRTYGGGDQDEAFSVAIDQTNNNYYFVFGYTQSYGGTVNQAASWQYQDLFLIKVDSSGNTLWQKVKGNRPTTSDFGVTICAVSDGGYAVSGSSDGNVLLAKFDGNGDTINLGATDLTITVPSSLGTINFGNAIDVAAAGAQAIIGPRELGAGAIDLLIATLRGQPDTSYCATGSYAFNPAPTVSAPSTTISFTNCETGPAGGTTTLNGSATINVTSFSYDFVSEPTYTIQTTLTDVTITNAETAGTLSTSITGGMRFYRLKTTSSSSERAESIDTATKLTFIESNGGSTTRTHVVGPFIIRGVVTTTGQYSMGTGGSAPPEDTATVDSGVGPLTITITKSIEGLSLSAVPASGSFRVTAPDSSQLTATITDGVAELAIDTNADGTVDGTTSTTWDVLY